MGTNPGSQETFQLQWDLYENNLRKAFRELRSNNKYFDVTVATEDGRAQAHRILLSASSPLLADILDDIQSPHPYVYLRGFKIKDFRAILDYVYKGEVSIPNEDLEDFLAAAEDLKIKGLAEDLYDDASLDTNKNIPELVNDPKSTNQNGVSRETLSILHTDDVQNIDKEVNAESTTKSLLKPLDYFRGPVHSPPDEQIRDSTASQVPGPISEDIDEETVEIGGFEIVSSFTPCLGQKQTSRDNTKDGSRSSLFGPSQEIANSEMILTHEEMADLENSIQHFSTETIDLDITQISPTKDWEESQNHIPMNDRSIEDFDDDDNSVESDLFPSHSPVVPPQFTASQVKEKENVQLEEIAPFAQSSKVGDPRIICLNASNKRKRKPNANPMKSKKVTKCNRVEMGVEKWPVNIPNVSKDLMGAQNITNSGVNMPGNIPVRGVNIPNMEVIKMPANIINVNKDLMVMKKIPVNIPNINQDLNEIPIHIPNLNDNLIETVSALEQFLPGKSPFENFNVANTNSILTVRKDITIDPSNDIACGPSIVEDISTSAIEEETPNHATVVNYSKNVEESNEQVLNPQKFQFNMSRLTHLNLTITKENENMEKALGHTDMLEMGDSGNQIPKSTNRHDSEVPMQIYSREKTQRSGRKSRSSSRSSNDAPSVSLNDLPTCRGSATVGFSSDLAISAVSDLLVENSGIHDRNAVLENGVDEIVLDDDDKDFKDKLILSNSLEDVEMLQTIFSSMLTVNQAGREWKCTECKQRFPGKNSRKYAEKHVDQAHTDHILHKCPQCEVLFKTLDAVERHKEIVHMQGEKEKPRGRPKGKGIQYKYS